MYFAVVLCAPTRGNLEIILWGTVGATAFYLLVNLAVGGGGADYWRLSSAGAYDPNDLAALFAVVLPLAVGLFLRYQGFPKAVALGISVVLVVGLLQTGSRGGILAMLAGVLVFVLGHRGFRFFSVFFGVFLGGIIAWQSASADFRERMMTLTALSEDYNVESEMGRLQIWKRGMSYFAERPIFGIGAGNFTEREGAWLLSQSRSGKWSAAHNAYVQAAAELGIVGISLYLALIISIAKRAERMWRVKISRRKPARVTLIRPEMLASVSAAATAAVFLSMAYSWLIFSVTAIVALADRVNISETAARAESDGLGGNGARSGRPPIRRPRTFP
jgi:O-antigen ligase